MNREEFVNESVEFQYCGGAGSQVLRKRRGVPFRVVDFGTSVT